MADTTAAQEERAKRLRRQIEEISKGQHEQDAPKTPRDFVNPARPGTSAEKKP